MGLADRLASGPSPYRGNCKIRSIADAIGDDGEALLAMCDSPDWSDAQVMKALAEDHDIRVSHTTVARHRKRGCSC